MNSAKWYKTNEGHHTIPIKAMAGLLLIVTVSAGCDEEFAGHLQTDDVEGGQDEGELAVDSSNDTIEGSTTEATAEQTVQLKSIRLATFELSSGNEVRIVSIPQWNEVHVGEVAPAGREQFSLSPELTLPELYDRLAPADLPVPATLLPYDSDNLLAGRPVVHRLETTVRSDMGVAPVTDDRASVFGTNSCTPGSAGKAYFEDHHCGSSGGCGYGKSDPDCFPGSYNDLNLYGSKMRHTWSVMASCGGANTRLQHYYKKSGNWKEQVDEFFAPGQVVAWWSYKKGIKRTRRVRMREAANGSSAWVRGWALFHDQVAQGGGCS